MANKKSKENEEQNRDAGHTFEDYVKRALNQIGRAHV